jgi:flagellar biosynthesis chaperone FliJ
MTIRIRVIRNLKDVRTRLRDIAAAAHSNAAAQRDRSAQHLEDQSASLESALDRAASELATARTVHDLGAIAETTGSHRLSLADAIEHHQLAVAASETTAGQLRERTRQLRTAERLVEQADTRRAKRESRAEQRRTDDLAARRR